MLWRGDSYYGLIQGRIYLRRERYLIALLSPDFLRAALAAVRPAILPRLVRAVSLYPSVSSAVTLVLLVNGPAAKVLRTYAASDGRLGHPPLPCERFRVDLRPISCVTRTSPFAWAFRPGAQDSSYGHRPHRLRQRRNPATAHGNRHADGVCQI